MSTILIVDDEPVNRQMLAALLGYEGHQILQAGDGAEALGVARRARPALVIADIVMPTMDGYEFVRQLRRDWQIASTPVMFYTANYFEREARGLAAACGVSHVLTKPAEPETILASVREVLGAGARGVPPAAPMSERDFDKDHVRVMTDKLSAKISELEATKQRLQALVIVGQRLNQRQDIAALLTQFCAAGREIIAARIAAVGLVSDDRAGFAQIAVAGADRRDLHPALRAPVSLSATPLGLPIGRGAPLRTTVAEPTSAPDPGGAPHATAFLGAPLHSGDGVVGCICFIGRLGSEQFTDEDEQMAVSLAGQLSVAYDNARHMERTQQANALLEARVAARTAELQRSNEELEQFAYVASHDLQEPLRAIATFSQLLGERYKGRLGSDADEFITFIVDGAARMKALISDLLAYSRVNSRGRQPTAVPADRPLRTALKNLAHAIDDAHAIVAVADMPTVLADESQLSLLFQNLIGNAVKFHGEQPPMVHVDATQNGGEFVFRIRDNGIGIDRQYADRIFQMFQRLHGRSAYPGTGIGLAICKRIVTRLGGRIWVDSQEGAGATFSFTLPAASAE